MTFSLVARDAASGAFGAVICSSSPAVAARCVHLADGAGAVLSQNVTDLGVALSLAHAIALGPAKLKVRQLERPNRNLHDPIAVAGN